MTSTHTGRTDVDRIDHVRTHAEPRGVRRRVLLAAAVALGALTTGCATEVEPVRDGPPVSPVVAARPIDVEWTNRLCTNLDPLFTALAAAPASAGPESSRLDAAQQAVRAAINGMTAVSTPPSRDAQEILAGIDTRLREVSETLDRGRLPSFDRSELRELLRADLTLQNALVYAPACVARS